MIRYENEHTSLDFKRSQYMHKEALLKDLIAMANAHVDGPQYIVAGVKCFPNGEREFYSIDDAFVDDAEYQELVRVNVEPELKFSYQPYRIDGNLLGVFTIHADDERKPYMMRRDFGSLKEGDSYIRRGSQQRKMTLADFNAVYEVRHKIIKERETKTSHIHFFIKELQNNQTVLHRLKSYTGEGPNILELFDPANELCNHFEFEIWDVLIASGIISTLDFDDKNMCRYAVKTLRDVRREIKTVAANWRRVVNWYEHDMELKKTFPESLIQTVPPEVTLKHSVPGCTDAITISLEAVSNAILVLQRLYDNLRIYPEEVYE